MKKIFTFFGVILVTSASLSQTNVNDPSFENWGNIVVKDSIEFWTTSTQELQNNGIMDVNNSYQVGNAKDGNYAIHLETVFYDNNGSIDTLFGYAVKENVSNGFQGFPYNSQVDEFKGWYKSDIQGIDTAFVLVQLSLAGTIFDGGQFPIYGTNSTWTQFSIPLNNGSFITPDSVFIGFASSHFQNNTVIAEGSWIEIDSVGFDFSGPSTPAALPNFSFESLIQETIEQPTDWWSFDASLYSQFGTVSVTKSTDAQDGLASMRIETTIDLVNSSIPSIVSNGYFNFSSGWLAGGAPFNAQPDTFSVKYKFTPSGIDTAAVILESWNTTTGMLVDTIDIWTNGGTWTTKNIQLGYTEAPDSIRVSFFSGNNAGSVLLVDDIQFIGGDLGFEEPQATTWNMYPNPANENIYVTNIEDNAKVEIYNLNGQLIYSNYQTNNKQLNINVSDWENGIYLIKINSESSLKTKKIVVKH